MYAPLLAIWVGCRLIMPFLINMKDPKIVLGNKAPVIICKIKIILINNWLLSAGVLSSFQDLHITADGDPCSSKKPQQRSEAVLDVGRCWTSLVGSGRYYGWGMLAWELWWLIVRLVPEDLEVWSSLLIAEVSPATWRYICHRLIHRCGSSTMDFWHPSYSGTCQRMWKIFFCATWT